MNEGKQWEPPALAPAAMMYHAVTYYVAGLVVKRIQRLSSSNQFNVDIVEQVEGWRTNRGYVAIVCSIC